MFPHVVTTLPYTGDGAGLPAFAFLWPTWLRQEDPDYGPYPTDVWPRCREGHFLFNFLISLLSFGPSVL